MAANDLAQLRRWTRERDPDAFDDLVRRYAGMVFGVSRRILRNDAEAEEISQECFLRLAQADTIVKTNVPGWLHRTATNLSLNRYKENQRRAKRETTYASASPGMATPEWNDLEPLIDAAINELPERQRALIIRHYLDSKTYLEVAEEFSITQSQAVYRIRTGVDRIRKTLKRQGVAAPVALLAAALASAAEAEPPASLIASLGKAAIAGPSRAAATFGAATATPMTAALNSWIPLLMGVLMILVSSGAFFTGRNTDAVARPATSVAPVKRAGRRRPHLCPGILSLFDAPYGEHSV